MCIYILLCSSFSFLYDSYACFCDADCFFFFFKLKGKQLNFTGSFRNRSVAQKINKKKKKFCGRFKASAWDKHACFVFFFFYPTCAETLGRTEQILKAWRRRFLFFFFSFCHLRCTIRLFFLPQPPYPFTFVCLFSSKLTRCFFFSVLNSPLILYWYVDYC